MEKNNNLVAHLDKKSAESDKLERIIFDIIFKHIKDCIFVMKAEPGPIFRYIFVNEEAYKCIEFSRNFIGKTMKETLKQEIYDKLQEAYI